MNSASLDQFSKAFNARLMALSETHNLLTVGEWRSAPLRNIIMLELSPYEMAGDRKVTVVGPEVQLNSRQALALGLTVHELATNAAKYGAFSSPNGKVDVAWDVTIEDDRAVLQFRWIESGGPVVTKPRVRGFGSQLIEHSLASEAGAEVHLDFHPQGACYSLKLPLDLGTA
jgi:two-component sensor histidine kinase